MRHPVATSPCDQLGHIVASDRVDRPGSAKVLNQAGEIAFRVFGTSMVLSDFMPITAGGIVERHADARAQPAVCLDALALGFLYGLRFPSVRPFRRAVKASTSPLEVEVVVRRALGLVDGHDAVPSAGAAGDKIVKIRIGEHHPLALLAAADVDVAKFTAGNEAAKRAD